MSAILSADDLNDFISPGVACIKPVETLPLQKPEDSTNPYEVTTEEKLAQEAPPPASITLTDCLACSGCVTSAEAVLVSLQSHAEVLNALDTSTSIPHEQLNIHQPNGDLAPHTNGHTPVEHHGKVFVASVSPQVRASLAATYGVTMKEAGWMIEQLLSGPQGLSVGGSHGNSFAWVVDTNAMREASLVMGTEEALAAPSSSAVQSSSSHEEDLYTPPNKPVLTSACPGWICYAEKTHPHVLPHLSNLKSPQALTGIMLKTVLSRSLNIHPSRIWHLAIMPCFDKKLEASRQELTDAYWNPSDALSNIAPPVRDVDCVITARELLMLAESRGVSFPALPRKSLDASRRIPFPDPILDSFLFPKLESKMKRTILAAGSSGGHLYHVIKTEQRLYPRSIIYTERGRNADVLNYTLVRDDEVLFRAARYYGFRNIQNLVRKLKPLKTSRLPGGKAVGARKPRGAKEDFNLDYVEVMACPGGCTNGGGQIKIGDLGPLQGVDKGTDGQKEWLARVDEAYYSMDDDSQGEALSSDGDGDVAMVDGDEDIVNDISTKRIKEVLTHWSEITQVNLRNLLYTSYRKVESDVGKTKGRETERVAELAGKIGGGW